MFRERGGGRERGRERGSGASEQGPLVGRKNGVPTLDPRPASWGRGVLRPIFFLCVFTHLLDGVVSGLCRDDELHELHLLAPPKVAHGGAGLPPSPLPPRRTPISGALGPSASPLTMKPSRNSEKSSISINFSRTKELQGEGRFFRGRKHGVISVAWQSPAPRRPEARGGAARKIENSRRPTRGDGPARLDASAHRK